MEQQLLPSARVRELLAELLGTHLALGAAGCRDVAAGRGEAQIKAALQRAPVLQRDETGVRRAGKLAWAHVSCTARLTHDAIHARRGSEATDAIGILPSSRGVNVHDGWKP